MTERKKRILIVDHGSTRRAALSAALIALGHEVVDRSAHDILAQSGYEKFQIPEVNVAYESEISARNQRRLKAKTLNRTGGHNSYNKRRGR